MKHSLRNVALAATTLITATAVAAPIVNVPADQATIPLAIANVDAGGQINITVAGIYGDPITLAGGEDFTMTNTSGGTVTIMDDVNGTPSDNLGEGRALLLDSDSGQAGDLAGAVDVTFENIRFQRDLGTGSVIDIDQDPTTVTSDAISFTMTNCEVVHTLVGSGGEAVKLDDGHVGGATVTFTATDTLFETNQNAGSGKAALRVQDSTWENLNVTLTGCTFNGVSEGTIRNDGGNNQTWVIDNCTVNAPNDRAMEWDDPHDNCSITITDSTFTAGQECIRVSEDSINNTWILRRNTFDNSTATGSGDDTLNIDYNSSGGLGTGNSIEVTNCLILVGDGLRGIDIDAFIASGELHHNTIVTPGTTEGERAITSSTSSGVNNASNNIFIRFTDPVSGSYAARSNNYTAGSTDEGAGDITHFNAADLATALTALGLDSSYVPQSGSVVLGAGDNTINVGSVDRNGGVRPLPAASDPDVGCFEVDQSASVSDWELYLQ